MSTEEEIFCIGSEDQVISESTTSNSADRRWVALQNQGKRQRGNSAIAEGGDDSTRSDAVVTVQVPKAKSDTRSRGYCLTLNNPTDEEYDAVRTWLRAGIDGQKAEVAYGIVGKEIGEVGTRHLQMYVYFKNAKSFSAMKKIKCFSRCHIEGAKGNSAQNKAYCSKDNDYEEWGDLPSQGKRSDLDDVAEMINQGASCVDIAKSFPVQYIKFCKGITQLRYLSFPGRTVKTIVYWLYGPTGTGKSHRARDLAMSKGTWYYKDPTSKWWDGYEQQKVVVVDDYRRDFCTFAAMLRLFDEYELKLEFKGGYVSFNSEIVIITTPKSPRDTWESQTEEQLQQLLRRIDFVEHFPALFVRK